MDPTTIKTIADMVDIFVKIAALIGGFWAIYKVIQFRELKQRIQLDIDANMYRLASPEQVETYN